jgi:hypothetical protein
LPKRGTDVAIVVVCATIGRGLTKRNLVSTLEQSPERGDTAANQDFLGTAPGKRDGRAYQRQPRPHRHEDSSAWVAGAIRNKE